jgi:hypothetical protein
MPLYINVFLFDNHYIVQNYVLFLVVISSIQCPGDHLTGRQTYGLNYSPLKLAEAQLKQVRRPPLLQTGFLMTPNYC